MATFHDRRPAQAQPAHPDTVLSRLAAHKARTKLEDGSSYGGHHGVYHGGQRVGALIDHGVDEGDLGNGRYEALPMNPREQVLESHGPAFNSRARAARWTVAAHDVSANRLPGMTKAHWDYVDKGSR